MHTYIHSYIKYTVKRASDSAQTLHRPSFVVEKIECETVTLVVHMRIGLTRHSTLSY